MANFETVKVETDLLILGGGMASCGAAVEAAHWAKKNNLKVTMVDKAAVDRSGAVAMGLSAINQYVGLKEGDNTIEDYVNYVKQDLMGVARDDLVASIARHVDGSVHLFEKWGLPIWKAEGGGYVHEGRWQLMINGESYKVIVAEAAKNHLGVDNIMWTVKFRNGTLKRFKFPIRTTPEGEAVPTGGFAGEPPLEGPTLFTEPDSLGLPEVWSTK